MLQELAARETALNADLKRQEDKADKVRERLGGNKKDAENLAEAIAECRALLQAEPLTDDAGLLASVAGLAAAAPGDKVLTYKNTVTVESAVRSGLTAAIDALSKRLARAETETVRLMADFRNKYPNETTEIDASLDAAGDYERLLDQLETNDLPKFEAHFKESLNQNTIHEVVAFNAFLDSRRQDIVSRITEINLSLGTIEYNRGRHIQLEHQNTTDLDVRQFGTGPAGLFRGDHRRRRPVLRAEVPAGGAADRTVPWPRGLHRPG